MIELNGQFSIANCQITSNNQRVSTVINKNVGGQPPCACHDYWVNVGKWLVDARLLNIGHVIS